MSEFEKAKQQISELKRQAEERRTAEEAKKRQGAELEERKRQERSLEERNLQTNLQTIKDDTLELLEQINTNLLGDNGTVSGWEENVREYEKTSYETFYGGGCDYAEWVYTERFRITTLESRLQVPQIGDIVVSLPVKKQKLESEPKSSILGRIRYRRVWRDYLPAPKDREVVHVSGHGSSSPVSLCLPRKEFLEKFKQITLATCVNLFDNYYQTKK
jgi:hypothetical protein